MSDMNVSLKVKATAEGEESIRATAAEVEKLGAASQRAAGDAAPLKAGMEQAADGSDKLAASIGQAGRSMAGFVAAAAGVSGLADLTRNTVELADRYGMLSARVKLATESEQEHAAAMTALFDIAQRNSASLEATADLYGKVAVSVRELGGSQADALAMTEAVSQSMRLSGASASAAEGAILQLGQALASGALRGDEFNSIAEASPRLMQALADGLGVARGELRAMAEQGKLTAEVVTQALLSQKEALAAEYQQLPDTVGAALQRLRNEWMKMVGEFDQANGITARLASGIGALTRHLDDLAAVAGVVGGAVAAGLAAKGSAALIQFAGDLAAAAEKAGGLRAAVNSIPTSVKIGVALAGAEIVLANLDTIVEAMARNSQAAKDAESAQERANNQLIAGQRAAIATAEGLRQYADTAVLSAQQVAALSQTERTRYQAGVQGATDFERAHLAALLRAKALGVHVDADLAKARERMAELRQGAEDIRLGFEIAARGGADLYAEAARMVDASRFAHGLALAIGESATQGKDAAGQIDAIIASVDLLQPGNVGALGQAMRELRDQSAKAADLLDQRLAAAIQTMSAADLAQFGQSIRAAFESGRMAAEDFAKTNDHVLSASFTKIGLTAETALGRISPAAGEAIAALDGIRQAVAATADSGAAKMQALEMAVAGAIGQADTQAAVEALRGRIEAMGKAGELSAEQLQRLSQQVEDQRLKIDQATPGINSMAEAYKTLGMTATAELERLAAEQLKAFEVLKAGKAPLEELETAFITYATSAIKANGGVADSALLAQAQTMGLRGEVTSIEAAAVQASDAMRRMEDRFKASADAAARETQAVQQSATASVAAAKAALESAKAKGDQNEVSRATVQLAQAEAAAAGQVAAAKQVEADAAWAKVEAVKNEVMQDGLLSEADMEVVAASERVAEAKQAEADAMRRAADAKSDDAAAADANAAAGSRVAASNKDVDSVTTGATEAISQQAQSYADAAAMAESLAAAVNAVNRDIALGLSGYYSPVGMVESAILRQKAALDSLIDTYESGRGVAQDFASSSDMYLQHLARTGGDVASFVDRQFSLLSSGLKSNLVSAIESARQKFLQLSDAARSTLASVQDELDQMHGNLDEIEQRRADQKIADIQAQIAEAQAAGNAAAVADLEKALGIQQQINDEKIKEAKLREQEAAKSASTASATATKTTAAATQTVKTVNVTLNGKTVQVVAGSEDALLQALEDAGLRAS